MVSIGEKLFQSFRNLKSDAVPQAPRPQSAAHEDDEVSYDEDTASVQEEIIIEPDDSQDEDDKKKKTKKSFFFSSKKKKAKSSPGKKKYDDEAYSTPINTQASGNVINVMNCDNVHWGNSITYNMGAPPAGWEHTPADTTPKDVKKTKSIVIVMEATVKPQHEYIDHISKNLGKNWHNFFKVLGYTKGQIETMEIDEARNGVSEARYKLLLDWTRNDDDGTLGRLASLLWQEGEKEIVKELANMYKKSTSSSV